MNTLESVDYIAAEDTRVTSKLLAHYSLSKPLISLEKHSETQRSQKLLSLLQDGHHIALVSDAGTPCISDPGSIFVQLCIQHDIPVTPIPGPSAVSTLLSASGLDRNNYAFLGFFPRKTSDADTLLSQYKGLPLNLVFFESPHRLLATVTWLSEHYPSAQCVFAKELTKQFESLFYGTPSSIQEQLSDTLIKGEWAFAIQIPAIEQPSALNSQFLLQCQALKLTKKDILSLTHTLGWKKNDVYNALLALDNA